MTIKRHPCKGCGGEGEVWRTRRVDGVIVFTGLVECGRCQGTGLDESVEALEGEI